MAHTGQVDHGESFGWAVGGSRGLLDLYLNPYKPYLCPLSKPFVSSPVSPTQTLMHSGDQKASPWSHSVFFFQKFLEKFGREKIRSH